MLNLWSFDLSNGNLEWPIIMERFHLRVSHGLRVDIVDVKGF